MILDEVESSVERVARWSHDLARSEKVKMGLGSQRNILLDEKVRGSNETWGLKWAEVRRASSLALCSIFRTTKIRAKREAFLEP